MQMQARRLRVLVAGNFLHPDDVQRWGSRLGQADAVTRSASTDELPARCVAVHRSLLKLALALVEGNGARAARDGQAAVRTHVLCMLKQTRAGWCVNHRTSNSYPRAKNILEGLI